MESTWTVSQHWIGTGFRHSRQTASSGTVEETDNDDRVKEVLEQLEDFMTEDARTCIDWPTQGKTCLEEQKAQKRQPISSRTTDRVPGLRILCFYRNKRVYSGIL